MTYKDTLHKIIKTTFSGNKPTQCPQDENGFDDAVRKNILIVEDDELLLSIYVNKFKKHNFEVKTALTGESAFTILRDGFKPDILLIDLILPVINGFEVFETIKKENLAQGAVAIMLTNQGLTSEIGKAKDSGFQGFIVKAMISSSDLVQKVLEIYRENKK